MTVNLSPHVEDKIKAGVEGGRRLRHAHHQIAAEQDVTAIGGFVGKIQLRREHRLLGSLYLEVIVAGAARIEGGHDGAETIAALGVGKEVPAVAEA